MTLVKQILQLLHGLYEFYSFSLNFLEITIRNRYGSGKTKNIVFLSLEELVWVNSVEVVEELI